MNKFGAFGGVHIQCSEFMIHDGILPARTQICRGYGNIRILLFRDIIVDWKKRKKLSVGMHVTLMQLCDACKPSGSGPKVFVRLHMGFSSFFLHLRHSTSININISEWHVFAFHVHIQPDLTKNCTRSRDLRSSTLSTAYVLGR